MASGNEGRDRPTVILVDASVAVTGALVSAARQAELLADLVDTVLVLPRGHCVPPARTVAFAHVVELPLAPLRKSLRGIVGYLPGLVAASIGLRRLIRRHRATRIQFNDFHLAHGTLLRLLGFSGRIVTFVRIDPRRFGAIGRVWLRLARISSDEMIAVSRFIHSRLAPVPSRLVYEALSADPLSRRKHEKDQQLFLFVGNFIDGKGQDDAIRAFNTIASTHPSARLRMIGGDMGLEKNRRYVDRLQALIASGGTADRIEILPPSDRLDDEYAAAFAALNFSVSESFSLTCLEAHAAALPIVATRCGGPEEILVDGQTGYLVPVGDVPAMANRMRRLLDRPDEARRMGEAGRTLVADRFAPDHARAALSAALDLP